MLKGKQRYALKTNVTVFYTVLMVLLSFLIIFAFYLDMDLNMATVSNRALEESVHDSFDDISAPGTWLELSDDFDYVHDDVHILLYGADEQLIAGTPPRGFPIMYPLISDEHRTVTIDDVEWRIYDFSRTYPNGSMIWVRGIYPMNQQLQSMQNTFRTIIILTPLLILLVAVVGYTLTWRGFRPMRQMIETSKAIEAEQDLSRRIQVDAHSAEEFVALGTSYNRMLDSVEDAFRREKQFSGDVAHELRTPVSVIISQAEYARTQSNSPETDKALDSILENSQRISRMIQQLLTLSRHEEGKIPLPDTIIDVSELVEMVADTLSYEAERKDITIHTKITPSLHVRGDQTELMRLLINIARNGIAYGRYQGHLQIDVKRSKPPASMNQGRDGIEHWIRIDIEDNGQGISQKNLSSIFKRFYQVDPSRRKDKDGSSGLGLTMSLSIARRHGGTITVASVEGEGSVFSIYLPESLEITD